jgi:hypothetical protein
MTLHSDSLISHNLTLSCDRFGGMTKPPCSVKGCVRSHYAKGLCQMHYARLARGKDLGPATTLDRTGVTPNRDEYTGEESQCQCGKTFRRRTIGTPRMYCSTKCRAKYTARARRAAGYVRPALPPCTVDGCKMPQLALGYCSMHHSRLQRFGDPGEADTRRARKGQGQWHPNGQGYIVRSRNGTNELQHRVVMAEQLGRELHPDENAHHRNGDRSDNRPENLELWSTWQPAGQRVEEKVAWARELLARYEPEGY